MVIGKKSHAKSDDEDNPLELLPEKRITRKPPPKDVSNDLTRNSSNNNSTTSDPGSLFRSLSFLIDDLKLLNYSIDNTTIEQVTFSSDNSLGQAVYDLFIDEDEIDGDDRDRH